MERRRVAARNNHSRCGTPNVDFVLNDTYKEDFIGNLIIIISAKCSYY